MEVVLPKFSEVFGLNKPQAELDFVDVSLETDIPLFIDPFALSQRLDRFSIECHQTVLAFFQLVVDDIRGGREARAKELLMYLKEPNETRLGLSEDEPQGAGIGRFQAERPLAFENW